MRTGPARWSFMAKAGAMALLIAVADLFFFEHEPGWTLGLFAGLWLLGLVAVVPAVRRNRAAWVAVVAAAAMAFVLVEAPGPLPVLLFGIALTLAALLPRRRFDDAFSWAVRLVLQGIFGLTRPGGDLLRLLRLPRRKDRTSLRSLAVMLALPVGGSALFLALFSNANPLISDALASVRVPDPTGLMFHMVLWAVILFMVWPSLRPHPRVTLLPTMLRGGWTGPEPAIASITLSLVAFNLIFALQNGLDIVFLWSGARLPGTLTLADYAHRGAYTLIATALFAGLFVLVLLRPRGAAARSPGLRGLVTLWVAQNLLLVASSMLRTLDYVEAYSLTVLRLAALLWMGLVALGLVLICWRLLAGRSARWLVNANAAVAALVLLVSAGVDFRATAAEWNVRHAREAGGPGQPIDLCYLNGLGSSALLPVIDFERGVKAPAVRDRAAWVRSELLARLEKEQADWHSWSWRNARRLAAARALEGPGWVQPEKASWGRECDGTVRLPPPAPQPPVAENASAAPANTTATESSGNAAGALDAQRR